MKRMSALIPFLLMLFLAFACSLPQEISQASISSTPVTPSALAQTPQNFMTEEVILTLTQAADPLYQSAAATQAVAYTRTAAAVGAGQAITPVPTTPAVEQCAFVWATRTETEITTQLESSLQQAGMGEVTVFTQSFGENCVTASGVNQGFGAMQTEFRLGIPVESTADKAALGDRLGKILAVLLAFPKDQIPGPNPSKVQINFNVNGNAEDILNFELPEARAAVDEGKTGEELYFALR